MSRIFYDTETCGFVGFVVTIQYQCTAHHPEFQPDDEIQYYQVWMEPVEKTLRLIEWMITHEMVGFNLVFDHFHLSKCYTVFQAMSQALPDCVDDPPVISNVHAHEIAGMDGPCLKPASVVDLMLVARAGKYQKTMERKAIIIRKIPTKIAYELQLYLQEKIVLDPVLFARKAQKHAPQWFIKVSTDRKGQPRPELRDLILRFKPGSGLKLLASTECNLPVIPYDEIKVPEKMNPLELQYAPFADACDHPKAKAKKRHRSQRTWPHVIWYHIHHWNNCLEARQYAIHDVVMTRELWKALGSPESDVNSQLAVCVSAVRWRGFMVDHNKLNALHRKLSSEIKAMPRDGRAVTQWIHEALSPEERLAFTSTSKKVLNKIIVDPLWEGHPVLERCRMLVENRRRKYVVKLLEKFMVSRRFHFNAKVMGTLSNRMSGDSGINGTGIPHDDATREIFTFAHPGEVCGGGDFEGFEVSIADARYADPKLHAELASGQKIKMIFARLLFPGVSDEVIKASEGQLFDMVDLGKRGVFAEMYGGNWSTLVRNLDVSEEVAKAADTAWVTKYPGIGRARQKFHDAFASMKQPGGIGTKVIWSDPKDYIETIYGDRRYFTIENMICKALFDISANLPDNWRKYDGQVMRGDRIQSLGGAVMSALYGAAFGIQSKVVRAAGNHDIQCTGARITKELQLRLWDIQPVGIHNWRIQPANIHDEIMSSMLESAMPEAKAIVVEILDKYRQDIPLLNYKWDHMKNWSS